MRGRAWMTTTQAGPDGRAPARSRRSELHRDAPESALGRRTSPTSRPGAGLSTSPLSSTSSRAASSAGASRRPWRPTSSSTRSSKRSTTGVATTVGDLVHHSDRGTQYLSMRYTDRLADAGIAPSVGSRGDSYDNALAESVIGLFKTEVIRRLGPWRTSRSRRIRDARLGGLVQSSTAARAHRLRAAGRVRSALL